MVVIDPGHGGKDPGTSGHNMVEKNIVLPLALKVAAMLRQAGFRVVCTRTDDSYPTLEDRVKLAEKNKAAVFLSIHANAFTRTTTRGVETVYPAKGTHAAVSASFGKLVQAGLTTACPDTMDRRAKSDVRNLYILKNAPCATAIAEIGFLTNAEDAAYIADPERQQDIAVGLANAVIRYFNGK